MSALLDVRSARVSFRARGGGSRVAALDGISISIAEGETNPVGMRVVGCDLVVAGKVVDAWIDRSEHMLRYLEVETEVGDAPRKVLVPMNFCVMRNTRDREKIFYVNAIRGEHFAHVPDTKKKTQVTFLEEDKITAYFGSGLLYATPDRQESIV